MSVLWFAVGEEIEFGYLGAGVVTDNSGGKYRSTYTRGSLQVRGNIPAGTGKLADGLPIPTGAITSGWLSGQWAINSPGSIGSIANFGMGNTAHALGGFFLGLDSVAGNKYALYTSDTAGVLTKRAAEAGTSASSVITRIDIQFTNWNNAATNIKVYINGNTSAIINWTGDTTGIFANLDCFRYLSNGTNNFDWISEIIIADEDTRAFIAAATLFPNGNGHSNTWDSGNYTDIDELVLDDSDMITSGTNGQIFECNMSDLPAGNFLIRAAKVAARASCGAMGPQTLQLGVYTNATLDTVNKSLTNALTNFDRIMPVNPVTAINWTQAEINALQLGLESAA